jgi:phosphohistidine phosphatase
MQLILWRHAEAEDSNPQGDLARNLTKKGRKQAERMAAWLAPRLDADWRILSSPAARAVQTVAPLDRACEVRDGLAPERGPRELLREAGWPAGGRVVVVGHQPTLGEVAAQLLGGDEGEVSIKKGAIWWFTTRERDANTETVLKVVIDPEMLEDREKDSK